MSYCETYYCNQSDDFYDIQFFSLFCNLTALFFDFTGICSNISDILRVSFLTFALSIRISVTLFQLFTSLQVL